jgi:hypothetical protein
MSGLAACLRLTLPSSLSPGPVPVEGVWGHFRRRIGGGKPGQSPDIIPLSNPIPDGLWSLYPVNPRREVLADDEALSMRIT